VGWVGSVKIHSVLKSYGGAEVQLQAVNDELQTPAALSTCKQTRDPLDRKLDGSKNWSGCCNGEEILPLPVTDTLLCSLLPLP
jgi:hypothetical protein